MYISDVLQSVISEPAPRPFRTSLDPALVVGHAVPHCVLPQLLRPLVAAFVGPFAIAIRTVADAVPCVTNLRVDSDMAPALRYASALPHLTAISAVYNKKLKPVDLAPLATAGAFQELRTLDFRCCVELTDAAIQSVSVLLHLTSLDMTGCGRLTSASFRSFASLTCLEVLHLTGVKTTDDDLVTLAPLQRLRVLSLESKLKAEGLAALCVFPLQELTLQRSYLALGALEHLAPLGTRFRRLALHSAFAMCAEQAHLAPLSTFHGLEALTVSYDTSELCHIAALPHLKELTLTGRGTFDDADTTALAQLASLEKLQLEWAAVTPAVAVAFSRLVNLTELQMPMKAPPFLSELVGLPQLRKLSMGEPEADDCPHFAHLRALEDLSIGALSGHHVQAAPVLAAVALVPRLRTLQASKLDRTAVDDIRPLSRSSRLVFLSLEAAAPYVCATAAVFEVVSQLPMLEELRLRFTGAFDDGMARSLRSMPRLRKVWLGERTDFAAFRRALPHLAVNQPDDQTS